MNDISDNKRRLLAAYADYYATLSLETVDQLNSLVTEDFVFCDPFTTVQGPKNVCAYLAKAFTDADHPRFEASGAVEPESTAADVPETGKPEPAAATEAATATKADAATEADDAKADDAEAGAPAEAANADEAEESAPARTPMSHVKIALIAGLVAGRRWSPLHVDLRGVVGHRLLLVDAEALLRALAAQRRELLLRADVGALGLLRHDARWVVLVRGAARTEPAARRQPAARRCGGGYGRGFGFGFGRGRGCGFRGRVCSLSGRLLFVPNRSRFRHFGCGVGGRGSDRGGAGSGSGRGGALRGLAGGGVIGWSGFVSRSRGGRSQFGSLLVFAPTACGPRSTRFRCHSHKC